MSDLKWNNLLTDQLEWHWRNQLRPRLDGLTDEEYFWEPTHGAWSVRRRGESTAQIQGGDGDYVVEFAMPEPDPPPMTTIAWRIAHIVVGVFAARTAAHFGGPPADYLTWRYAGSATEALTQLDETHAGWLAGVRSWGEGGLWAPCGPAEGPFAEEPRAALILHISREAIHHGADIALLRDLYAHRS